LLTVDQSFTSSIAWRCVANFLPYSLPTFKLPHRLLGEFGKCHSGGGHRGISFGQVGGSHLNHIRAHGGHADAGTAAAARGKPLRVPPYGPHPARLAARLWTYTTSWDINKG
jgi:hypothetical protein